MNEEEPTSDHDLLIRIDTKLELALQTNGDHELRLRRLELWGALFVGGLYIINALLGFYLMYLSTKH